VNHPGLVGALTALKGGEVEGDFQFVKEGQEYTVTENMRVITDPNHEEYGKYSVGDTMEYKADQTIVDGFLELTPSFQRQQIEATANATASFQAQLLGMFATDGASASASASASSNEEDVEIPEDVLAAVAGADTEVPAEPAKAAKK
jgi:hypothetical protein